MQPTEESLKIAGKFAPYIDALYASAVFGEPIKEFALALDAAYQRGKDEAELLRFTLRKIIVALGGIAEPGVSNAFLSLAEDSVKILVSEKTALIAERKRLASEVLRLESELIAKSAPSLSSTEVGDKAWLPMESAPRDNRLKLSWAIVDSEAGNWNMRLTWWNEETQSWREWPSYCQPTYWMPLPAPPTEPVSNPLQLQLDAALAIAAQRCEILNWVEEALCKGMLKCYSPLTEIKIFIREHKAKDPTPERWLGEQIKRAKAEGAAEWLEREAERTLEEAESISLKLFYVDLHETAEKFKKVAAAIRKEAGLCS